MQFAQMPSRQMQPSHADPLLGLSAAGVAAAAAALGSRLPASPVAASMHHSSSLQQSVSIPQLVAEAPLQQTFSHATLEELRSASQKFAVERDWEKFHAPRNLLLALVRNAYCLMPLWCYCRHCLQYPGPALACCPYNVMAVTVCSALISIGLSS